MQPAAQVDNTLGTLKACGVVCQPLQKSIKPVVCAHELSEWLGKSYKHLGLRAEGVGTIQLRQVLGDFDAP